MSQELEKAPGTTTGTTGGTCSVSGFYRATDGRIEFIHPFVAGEKFFAFPGGTAKTKCMWTLMSKSTDDKPSYTAIKVATGSV
jgi:hypothetical protein